MGIPPPVSAPDVMSICRWPTGFPSITLPWGSHVWVQRKRFREGPVHPRVRCCSCVPRSFPSLDASWAGEHGQVLGWGRPAGAERGAEGRPGALRRRLDGGAPASAGRNGWRRHTPVFSLKLWTGWGPCVKGAVSSSAEGSEQEADKGQSSARVTLPVCNGEGRGELPDPERWASSSGERGECNSDDVCCEDHRGCAPAAGTGKGRIRGQSKWDRAGLETRLEAVWPRARCSSPRQKQDQALPIGSRWELALIQPGAPLVVQGLRLHPPSAGGPGFRPRSGN